MRTRRTGRTNIRRHARWDRIAIALAVLIGIIVLIGHFATTRKQQALAKPSHKPELTASEYFDQAIAPDTDIAISGEDSSNNYALLSGTDISRHNGDIVTDGDFVIIKATEGVGYVDPCFEDNIQTALDNGQLCGVYHYARPDTGNMPTVEAEHFVATVKPYLGKVLLVLDWEELEAIDNTTWVSAWLWQVYQMTGIRPVLYTSASVASAYDWTGISSQFDLWVACYVQDGAEIPSETIQEWDISQWRTIIWQYSTTGGTLDRNISSLTTEEWQNRCQANDEKTTGADLMETMQLLSMTEN